MSPRRVPTGATHQDAPAIDGPVRAASGPGWLLPTLLCAAAVAVYASSFAGQFFLDDYTLFVANENLQPQVDWGYVVGSSRPLTVSTFALNLLIDGTTVWGFHFVNLCVHALAGLLLFDLLRRCAVILGSHATSAARLAFVVALLWLVHPLQTQSVTYIVQRCESLMGLFFLLTIYSVVRGAEAGPNGGKWSIAAVLACALGMSCKPVMVTAPLLALLVDRAVLSGAIGLAIKKRPGLYTGLAATWLLLVISGVASDILTPDAAPRGVAKTAGFGYGGFTPWQYLCTQVGVIGHYVWLALWPAELCLDYQWPVAGSPADVLWPGFLTLLLLVATVFALWRKHCLGWPGVCFWLLLAPTSSIVPIQDMAAEHRMYLPLAALILAAVVLGGAALERLIKDDGRRHQATVGLIVLLTASLGATTMRRNTVYHDPVVMWNDVLEKRPQNARAYANLGLELRRVAHEQTDPVRVGAILQDALQDYKSAGAIRPLTPRETLGHGLVLFDLGRASAEHMAAATQTLETAVEREPSFDGYYHLGMAYFLRRQVPEALAAFQQALQLGETYDLYTNLGPVLAISGQPSEAIAALERALELNPQGAVASRSLAVTLENMGRREEALAQFRKTLELDPEDAFARRKIQQLEAAQ